MLAAADVALVASGTVTVQAALHGCPMVVVYRLSPLTYRLGRPFVQVDTFAMVNLVAGRKIVPELMQDDFTPERVAGEALPLLRDRDAAARMRTRAAGGARQSWASRARVPALPAPSSKWPRAVAVLWVRLLIYMRRLLLCLTFVLIPLGAAVSATVLIPAEFREIVAGSEIIVHARVVDMRSQWVDGRRRIESVVTVEVLTPFKGGERRIPRVQGSWRTSRTVSLDDGGGAVRSVLAKKPFSSSAGRIERCAAGLRLEPGGVSHSPGSSVRPPRRCAARDHGLERIP